MDNSKLKLTWEQLFVYLYLLVKIKMQTKARVVNITFLREAIKRIMIRKGGFHVGTVRYIIEAMVKLDLIERKNKIGLYILKEHPGERRIINLINSGVLSFE